MRRNTKIRAAVVSALAAGAGSTAVTAVQAQEAPNERAIEEIVVTATKRQESMQDVPVAVAALQGDSLEELRIDSFDDYALYLPNVTSQGTGPGQQEIYIRGAATSQTIISLSSVQGLQPSVALYVDEQPVALQGRNLDVYATDLARIEVLPGPQGTLFGASSQAGTVRLITNKPDFSGTYGRLKAGTSWTKGGEMSNNVEGMFNLPVSDKLALRGVVYTDNMGGYVDNVPGTLTARESARFRPAGTVRPNGVAVSDRRAGFQSTSDLSGVTFLEADNGNLAEDDFNDVAYNGFRLSGVYLINADWDLTVSHMQQELDADGVFYSDGDLDDYEVTRFTEDSLEDSFHNTAWTLKGRIGELEALYTGAFTGRETDQLVDYSDYLFVGQYLPYYICDSSVSYPGDAAPAGTCQPPDLQVNSITDTQVWTHEVRFNTPEDRRLRATFGGFYSDLQIEERNDFVYPGSAVVDGYGTQTGFSPNFPFTTGFTSDPGPFPSGTIFRNDVKRTDEQLGFFGEATYDLTDKLALTLGARYYDIEVDLEGGAN